MGVGKQSFARFLAPIILLTASSAAAQTLELVGRQDAGDGGAQGNGGSSTPAISADDRFVSFSSRSLNLIPGGGTDLNANRLDVFVFERATGALELVSRQDAGDGGTQGNNSSFVNSISADGQFVAFESFATNLIPGGGPDVNGTVLDVFVFDRDTGALELVSRQDAGDGGVQGNNSSLRPSISADGRFVAYYSSSTNLIPGGGPDVNGTVLDVFVFDRDTGALELVSRQDVGDGGVQGNNNSFFPSISADGRFVAFDSRSTNLIPGGGPDVNGTARDVFVFDRDTSALELVSRQDAGDGGAQGNSESRDPSISADGRFVTFETFATNLIPGGGLDANGTALDVFVFDRATGALELVSRQDAGDGGAQGNNSSALSSISADGRFVAFETVATNLIPGGGLDANGTATDVFIFDRATGALELVSRQDSGDGGAQGNNRSRRPSVGADGRVVAFDSQATNLIPGGGVDVNGTVSDVFVFDRGSVPGVAKAITGGPDNDGDGDIDVAIEILQLATTEYAFDIAYTQDAATPEVLIVDTVPAEWQVTEVAGDNSPDRGISCWDGVSDGNPGIGTVDVGPGSDKCDREKGATIIEWTPDPANANATLNVVATTRQSPSGKVKFKPTSCGPLFLNDGALVFELDPTTGEPRRDPVTDELLPPIFESEPLLLVALEDLDGGGLVGDGSGDEDGDTLTDLDEVRDIGTDPCLADTDGDLTPDNTDPDPLDPDVS